MKSFLGNFYRHLAICSGHTGLDAASTASAATTTAYLITLPKSLFNIETIKRTRNRYFSFLEMEAAEDDAEAEAFQVDSIEILHRG